MSDQKPKPCPFCGSTEIEEADWGRYFYVCTDCDACGPSNLEKGKNFLDSWNTRVTENKSERSETLMTKEYEKRLLHHLKNIDRIYRQEAKKLRFEITVKYIGEFIGREHDRQLALDVLREATK